MGSSFKISKILGPSLSPFHMLILFSPGPKRRLKVGEVQWARQNWSCLLVSKGQFSSYPWLKLAWQLFLELWIGVLPASVPWRCHFWLTASCACTLEVLSATPPWIADINAYCKMRIYIYRTAIHTILKYSQVKILKLWLKRPANISSSVSFHYFSKNVNLTGFREPEYVWASKGRISIFLL